MTELFAEAASDFSNWGIPGAMLVMATGFITYLRARDAQDREERRQVATELHKVIDQQSAKLDGLAAVFRDEMRAERESHREELMQIGQLIHDVRGMAQAGYTTSEITREIQKRTQEKNDN